MEDPEELTKARRIAECVAGPLQEAIRKLKNSLKELPQGQDFHYYSNFSQFRNPITAIKERAVNLLREIGSSSTLRLEPSEWPEDGEDAYDWLVGLQDDCLEKVDSALDAFYGDRSEKKKGSVMDAEDFEFSQRWQHVKKRGRKDGNNGKENQEKEKRIKVASRSTKERLPVPFHMKSIPRPQDKFDIPVDNSNRPFQHISREELLKVSTLQLNATANTEDGTSSGIPNALSSALEFHAKKLGIGTGYASHPLQEELRNLVFTDGCLADIVPERPKSLSSTPFTFVELPSALSAMAEKLRLEKEIAVDLENHHYRSFQGFVCLMQISTRLEDFVVDTIALRSHIGPELRDIFASSSIQKVMHGADKDIVWLQRDFGIYVCNLFDTGQAARVLSLPGFGLAYLLEHFCGVHADKRYQLADWRLRPLPSEMLRYAREDTHYLLYIYDMIRKQLHETLPEGLTAQSPYMQVCMRSQNICRQLYEKELLTETSYSQLYGLQDKQLSQTQLLVLSKLYAWRDTVARREDESTGYVLPNHLLFRIAEELPEDARKLHSMFKGSNALGGRHTATILELIRKAKSEQPNILASQSLEEEPYSVDSCNHRIAGNLEIKQQDGAEISGSASEAQNIIEDGEILDLNDELRPQDQKQEEPFPESVVIGLGEESRSIDIDLLSFKGASGHLDTCKLLSNDGSAVHDSSGRAGQTSVTGEAVVLTSVPMPSVPDEKNKLQAKVTIALSKPRGGLGAMLGGSGGKKNVWAQEGNAKLVAARLKADSIQASIVLPFSSIGGQRPIKIDPLTPIEMKEAQEPETREQNTETGERNAELVSLDDVSAKSQAISVAAAIMPVGDQVMNDVVTIDESRSQLPDVIPLDGEGTCVGTDTVDDADIIGAARNSHESGTNMLTDEYIPLSISEKYGIKKRHKRRKTNKGPAEVSKIEKSLCLETSNANDSSPDKDTVKPFDYEAAKKAYGYENILTTTDTDDRQGNRLNVGRKQRPVLQKGALFDPVHKISREVKESGFQPGKRRQVFPQSGNRSMTFK